MRQKSGPPSNKAKPKAKVTRPIGNRPLKVGETLRHTLAQILQRGDVHDLELSRMNITISEVRMSPDLGHATVFVAPLGGKGAEEMLRVLRRCQPMLRTEVAHAIKLRYAPELHFQLDTSFDYAETISKLLHGNRVIVSDLAKPESEAPEATGDDSDTDTGADHDEA